MSSVCVSKRSLLASTYYRSYYFVGLLITLAHKTHWIKHVHNFYSILFMS